MATIALKDGKVILKDGKVSCSCCGGGGCECQTTPTAELIPILDAATTATCNGLPSTSWASVSLPEPPGWYAIWAYSNIYTLRWYSDTKCLELGGDNAINTIASGDIECCRSQQCVEDSYTINGNSFPCISEIYDNSFPPVPLPSFILS